MVTEEPEPKEKSESPSKEQETCFKLVNSDLVDSNILIVLQLLKNYHNKQEDMFTLYFL